MASLLQQGFNWLISTPPNSPSQRAAARLSNMQSPTPQPEQDTMSQYHCSQCALRARIEQETSKQSHAFLKQICRDMSLHTRTPIDVAMYRYEGGKFACPNGFLYLAPENEAQKRELTPKQMKKYVAVIVIADDPLSTLDYENMETRPQLLEAVQNCKSRHDCQAVVITNYHRWVMLWTETVRIAQLERKVAFPYKSAGGDEFNYEDVLQVEDGKIDDPEYTVHRNMVRMLKSILAQERSILKKRKVQSL